MHRSGDNMSQFLSTLKKIISDWRENRRLKSARREEEKRRQAEIRRREEEHKQAMYRRGNEFEDYVRNMFPEDRFTLIHRTPTHESTGGRFVDSMVYPDLRFIDKASGRRFWVEVKFRSHAEQDGSIVWCTDNQLRNYKRTMYESGEKVLIMMGVGGTVNDPSRVYCLDLENINFTRLFYKTYRDHRVMYRRVESLKQLEYISSNHTA